MEEVKVNHKWFEIPKGTVVVVDGVRVAVTEDTLAFPHTVLTATPVKESK
jgi:hypothetical protein